MYLPTFWKLGSEMWIWKAKKVGGWGLPAVAMSKFYFHASTPTLYLK